MPTTVALSELSARLPGDVVLVNPDSVLAYSQDRASDPDAAPPLAVVRASTPEHVSVALEWAHRHSVPVVPRGAGTGLSGGASARSESLVLSLERMAGIAVDPDTRTATAAAGALNIDVKRAAAEHDLWYPPDPSSYAISTVGGNVATNAGGLCCVKYGVTSDYVLGMRVVLADGSAIRLGGPRLKDSAGYALTKLIAGSEGTLAVVTEVTLRLLPAPPPAATLVATFPSMLAATRAVIAITNRTRPSMLELMDNTTIKAVDAMTAMALDRSAGAILLARSDQPGPGAIEEIGLIRDACDHAGAQEIYFTEDPDEGEALAEVRRQALPAIERLGSILLEDVGVPVPRLPDLVDGIENIARHTSVTIAVIAHAGDGNTHPIIVYDPQREDQHAAARRAFKQVIELALSLDGTITGEHGVGRLKQPWLADQLGADVIDLHRRIKYAFDPRGILNPGVVIDPKVQPAGHPSGRRQPLVEPSHGLRRR